MARENLSWITKEFFYDFDDRSAINTGWCFVWAWLAKLAHPKAQLVHLNLSGIRAHVCVKIGHLYYDSARPCGVLRRESLPCVQENGPVSAELLCNEKRLIQIWDSAAHEKFGTQGLRPWPEKLPCDVPRQSRGRLPYTARGRVRRSQSKHRSSEAASET